MTPYDHASTALQVPGAHRRLEDTLKTLTEDEARGASALPGWTRGHVLTHIARHGDAMVRLLTGALHSTPAVQYPGGAAGRAADIEAGAGRPAEELAADVLATDEAVEAAVAAMTETTWAHLVTFTAGMFPASRCPWARWREVEIHHVDLGLDRYTIADWPAEFVSFYLPVELARLGERLGPDAAVEVDGVRYGAADVHAVSVDGPSFAVLAWLIGRAEFAAPHLNGPLPELPNWG